MPTFYSHPLPYLTLPNLPLSNRPPSNPILIPLSYYRLPLSSAPLAIICGLIELICKRSVEVPLKPFNRLRLYGCIGDLIPNPNTPRTKESFSHIRSTPWYRQLQTVTSSCRVIGPVK